MAFRAVLCCGLRLCSILLFLTVSAAAQTTTPPPAPPADSGTSTDFFIMPGSDFDRPGLVPRANLNIGIGHTFKFLNKDPIGDELTFTYTYENAGSHGFFHTNFGSHTEALGVMKNFNLPKTKVVTGYTWIQAGLTSFTGNAHVENRFYDGEALGVAIHSTITTESGFRRATTKSRRSRGTPPPASATPGAGKSLNSSIAGCAARRPTSVRATS